MTMFALLINVSILSANVNGKNCAYWAFFLHLTGTVDGRRYMRYTIHSVWRAAILRHLPDNGPFIQSFRMKIWLLTSVFVCGILVDSLLCLIQAYLSDQQKTKLDSFLSNQWVIVINCDWPTLKFINEIINQIFVIENGRKSSSTNFSRNSHHSLRHCPLYPWVKWVNIVEMSNYTNVRSDKKMIHFRSRWELDSKLIFKQLSLWHRFDTAVR